MITQLGAASRSYTGLTVLLVIVLAMLVGGVVLVVRSVIELLRDWRESKRERHSEKKKAA